MTTQQRSKPIALMLALIVTLIMTGCTGGGGALTAVIDFEENKRNSCTDGGGVTSPGGGTMTGSDNIQRAFNYLVSAGYSKEMAAGIVGNLQTESMGANPGLAEMGYGSQFGWDVPDNRLRGWGIVQWTWERHAKARQYVTDKLGREYYVSQYSSPTAEEFFAEDPNRESELLQAQLEYLLKEMQDPYYKSRVYDPMMQVSTPEEAADIFVRKFEVPANVDATSLVRQKQAREFFDQYANGAPDQGSGSADTDTDPADAAANLSDDGGGEPSSAGWHWMTDTPVTMTSPYGMRVHPITGVNKLHDGIDYGGGGNLYSVSDGKVEEAGSKPAWGNRVVIRLTNGDAVAYNHLASIGVSSGQDVKAGDTIGVMGTTGYSTGVHLHFNVYPAGQPLTAAGTVDPAEWLESKGFNHKNGTPNGRQPVDTGPGGGAPGGIGEECSDGSTSGGGGSGEFQDAEADPNDPAAKNLKPNTLKLLAIMRKNFPELQDIGGWRPSSGDGMDDHTNGIALDLMTYKDKALGDRIAKFVEDNHEQLKVDYQIWYQQIWNPAGGTSGGSTPANWRRMEDRGSPTQNHEDHVHITVIP